MTAPTLVSIAVTPVNPSIALGLTRQFAATGTYTNGGTHDLTSAVTWSSSATGVAAINGAGLATSVAQGSATISATSGSITGSTNLTVTAPMLASIAITPASPRIALGLTRQFTTIGTYTDGSTQDLTSVVVWNSSATGVATINSAGLATSVAQGSTQIRATSGSILISTDLTVTAPALVSIAVTPANSSLGLGLTRQFTATGKYSDNTTQDVTSTVAWSSSAVGVATINSAGRATSVAQGSTTIQAALGSISGSTTLTVTALFTVTGSMAVARVSHTVTVLNNGKILVTGGTPNGSDTLASAELYDPASGVFSLTGSMTASRRNHSATLLNDGKALITGGYTSSGSGTSLATAELYDPASGVFTATPSMAVARQAHTATLLTNGKVLIAGGSDPVIPTNAEVYDPATGPSPLVAA